MSIITNIRMTTQYVVAIVVGITGLMNNMKYIIQNTFRMSNFTKISDIFFNFCYFSANKTSLIHFFHSVAISFFNYFAPKL